MPNTYSFLTYNEIVDNDIHIGTSIDIEGLTLEDIKEAIERQKLLKLCNSLDDKTIKRLEENLVDFKKYLKEYEGRVNCNDRITR